MDTSKIEEMGACQEATDWLRTQPDPETAWRECRRGDWMLWLLGRLGQDRPTMVRIAADCAERALRFSTEATRGASEAAIAAARAWADDPCEERRDAAYAAAADAAAAANAACAAYAADAAGIAYSGAAAAADAAAVAYSGAYAGAAYATAGRKEFAAQAEIVRKYVPKCPKV